MSDRKPVKFRGRAREDLRAFPDTARQQAGYQLDKVQQGQDPSDWKPMTTIGPGTKEIRIRDEAGAFRVLYVTKLADARVCLALFSEEDTEDEPSGY